MFPKLVDGQIHKLADIASDIGLVALASVALPAILDQTNTLRIVFGSIAIVFFWFFSLWLLRIKK